ncbi:MAG: hypothetical protein Q9188_003758 [Gyalolechia gomerana]
MKGNQRTLPTSRYRNNFIFHQPNRRIDHKGITHSTDPTTAEEEFPKSEEYLDSEDYQREDLESACDFLELNSVARRKVSTGFMYNVNPTLQNLSKKEKETWQDAVGRASFAKMLILDTQPGMLDMMTETTYPDQSGKHPEFGEEILELARHLDD